MGLLDIFKSREEKEREKLLQKMYVQMFPGGKDQFLKEVGEIWGLLGFRYTFEDIERTYAHAAGKYHVAKDRTSIWIVASIIANEGNVVDADDAKKMVDYLESKYGIENGTIEYRDNQTNRLSEENEEMNWNTFLNDAELPKSFKEIVLSFLVPFDIDPAKFFVNKDATSDPYRYINYENEPLFSKNLRIFQEDRSLKAPGYPDWFYSAFPDVALWAIKGEGNKFIKELFKDKNESEVIDLSRKQLWEKSLKSIIEVYLENGHHLECGKRKIDHSDEFEF